MKISITIPDGDAALIAVFLAATKDVTSSSHGPLDMQKLAAMLLEDVALLVRRPSSWEGTTMMAVMASHGYRL